MTERMRLIQCLAAFCLLALLQGCVPIYCAVKYSRTPDTKPIELFDWTTSKGYDSQPDLDHLVIKHTDNPPGWVLFENYDHWLYVATEQIQLDEAGAFLAILPDRDMRSETDFIRFTNDANVYTKANLSVVIEEDTYPQALEVEAWLRQTFGRLIAPFMGKSGEAFITDDFSRFACCPPRVAITTTHADGTATTRRYTLPNAEDDYWEQYGTLISEDGQFLYIYFQHSGAIILLWDDNLHSPVRAVPRGEDARGVTEHTRRVSIPTHPLGLINPRCSSQCLR